MVTLRDVPLRSVPVVAPGISLEETMRRLEGEPLRTVVLVGDGVYMGVFDDEALRSHLIPRRADPATLAVGPYAQTLNRVGSPAMSVEQALALLSRNGRSVLPVVDNNIYRGIVTREDLERQVLVAA